MSRRRAKRSSDPLAEALAGLGARPLRDGDGELLLALYRDYRRAELDAMPWPEEEKERFLRAQFAAQGEHYRRVFAGGLHLIFEDDDGPFGRILVYRDRDCLLLVDVAFLPARRNAGLGGRVLDLLKDEARRLGQPLRFSVFEGNVAAKRFYERHGCHPTAGNGVYVRYAWLPEGCVDPVEEEGRGLVPRLRRDEVLEDD